MPSNSDQSPAFPVLDDAQIAYLETIGERRSVAAGEYLYNDGDATYDFYLVLDGEIEIVIDVDDAETVVVRHERGRFLGELNMLTGARAFVSARSTRAGEVVVVPRDALRRVIATNPQLSDVILAAFIARRSLLLEGAASTIRVIGSRYSAETLHIREFLTRMRVPHEWLDPDHTTDIAVVLETFGVSALNFPVVITKNTVLRSTTPGELADFLGVTVGHLPSRCFDLVVVGGGPAGLAACVYGASEGLRTLGIDAVAPGGQAGTTSRIENYLGFPLGISGPELTQKAFVQAEKFGADMAGPCGAVSLREEAGHLLIRLTDGTDVAARAAIVATGAHYRRLNVDRLEHFESNGVYYAATEMEARLCGVAPVVVVGGGNSAGQAAVFMAERGCGVNIVVRSADLSKSMSNYLIERIENHPRIRLIANASVASLEGEEQLQSVMIEGAHGVERLECAGLFSFIGADPASQWISGCAALDEHGFVLTDRELLAEDLDERWDALGRAPLPYETSHPGLFAVGDVRSGSTKRVAAAVGEGSACVSAVHQYLAFNK